MYRVLLLYLRTTYTYSTATVQRTCKYRRFAGVIMLQYQQVGTDRDVGTDGARPGSCWLAVGFPRSVRKEQISGMRICTLQSIQSSTVQS